MRNILNLNADWRFAKNVPTFPAEKPETFEAVNLPHTWNATDGQDGGNDYFRGTCCYTKQLLKSDLPEAEKYFLEIHGANSSADVYMNGKRLAHHDGGYSTWLILSSSSCSEKPNNLNFLLMLQFFTLPL